MKTVYKAFGKIFDTKEECQKYEDEVFSDKKKIAHNIALNYLSNHIPINDKWKVALPGIFMGTRNKFPFGKYKDYFVFIVILEDSGYVERCLSEVEEFSLTENEQLLLNAVNNIKRDVSLGLTCEEPDFEIINLLKERYLKRYCKYLLSDDSDNEFDDVFVRPQ